MLEIDVIESIRLELQSDLDSKKTQAVRNKLGQFATSTVLSIDMLKYARNLLPEHLAIRFLDPAFGTGAFYSALLRIFPQSRIAEAVGYEVDVIYGEKAIELWKGTPLRLNLSNFTDATPPSSDDAKADLIICNPPYVRHHHLTQEEKLRLQRYTEQLTGEKFSGLTGLYCYFLCLSHQWMAENGTAGWLIPAEFMDVNYGQQLKKFLLSHVTLLRIHRFAPKDMQFDDALVSSAVVWLKKAVPNANHTVEFTEGGTLNEPNVATFISIDVLRHANKWTKFFRASPSKAFEHKQLKLSDLFTIKRGLATGANQFFILTSQQVFDYQIPEEFLRPILPSPRYLPVDEIEADSIGNPILDRQLFLLGCDQSEEKVKSTHPLLWQFFQKGVRSGVSERYLCRHRSPWYSQENRPP